MNACRVLYVERQTLEIAVYPDAQVVVKAPAGTGPDAMQLYFHGHGCGFLSFAFGR